MFLQGVVCNLLAGKAMSFLLNFLVKVKFRSPRNSQVYDDGLYTPDHQFQFQQPGSVFSNESVNCNVLL